MPSPTIDWIHTDDAGDELTEQLPAHWSICASCDGAGASSAYLGAFTREDIDRDWDPESWQDYLGGRYDRPCDECKGTGKVLAVDFDRIPAELKARYEAHLEDEAHYHAMCAAERRMGA